MPWHDLQIMVTGPPVKDLDYHFSQYWNYAKRDIDPKKYKEFLKTEEKEQKKIDKEASKRR